jgi:hypothetical protein
MNRLISEIESWFEQGMQRVSGWYKRHTQLVILLLGIGMAGIGNIDSFHIARALYADASLRDVVAREASAFVTAPASNVPEFRNRRKPDAARGQQTLRDAVLRAQSLDLPIGWEKKVDGAAGPRIPEKAVWPWVTKVVGLLLTGFAASLGAPFWFDLLNRLATLRTSLRPSDSKKKDKKDAT